MKKIILFIMLFCYLPVFAQNEIALVKEGKSDYKIIISGNASADEKAAASILKEYLKKIFNFEFPVLTDKEPSGNYEIILGLTNRSDTNEYIKMKSSLNEDGFNLKTSGNKLYITGGSEKGIIYGVTGFLEDYLGCRKYSPAVEVIPKYKTFTLSPINDKQVPPAKIRIINSSFSSDENYKNWRKLAVVHDKWGKGTFGGYYVHTFNRFISSDDYFKIHPEYFSLINGERIPYGQLCLSNPEVLQIVIKKLGEEINKYPEIKYWSVSQNDNYECCQCPLCKAIDEEEGSNSGSLIRFVNKVAESFPEKIITTLAYQYSRKPPLKVKPGKNVMITLCTIELNRSLPIETDSTSIDFKNDIIGWSKICNNIMLWDYEVQFTNYFCPFPIFHTLQPNIQFFTKYNVTAHFQQCNLNPGNEFAELKGYYISKLLWNPDINADVIIDDFMKGYYEEAGTSIHKYFDLLHEEGKKSNQRFDIYGSPVWHSNTYLSKENILKYFAIFKLAEEAVKNKPEILERVKITELPVMFAELEISKTDLFGERGWYNLKNGKYILKPEMKAMLEEFYSICKRNNIQHLNENALSLETYYKNTLRSIDAQVEGNLAFKKPVTCNPMPAKKYFCSGSSTLTNGVRGSEDFKINWLGWEDTDFEIILDLNKLTKINQINISSLQIPKSWIIHPEMIECYISNNGKTYKKSGSLKIDGSHEKETDIHNFEFLMKNEKARFVKFNITGTKKLPQWHTYAGNKSWVFIDEIIIK
jgi:hypothetical protein